ncbi:MAG: hypothetical protein L6R42_001333 [Xanthoria sp. 1 TBL-2021]|nr:MAG: hypothetical protein L6R42_001333 [Xanthoria sp. 1 TBL-2021]
MELSSPPSILSSLVTSILLHSQPITTTTPPPPPPLLSPTTTTPSLISNQAPSPTLPFYSPTTHYTIGSTSSTSYLIRIQQTYLISGTSTSLLPTSGATIDETIPTWKPTPAFLMTGFGPGVADDGRVTDYAVFGSAER